MTTEQLTTIISSMTTAEKLAQLTQLTPVCFGFHYITPLTGPDSGLRIPEALYPYVGSVLNCTSASDMISIQKQHMEEDSHHIPLLFMADIIHGFKTLFPIPLAMSCSFSPENMEEACRIAALESSVSGIHVTFSPMADLVRDPRWGRVMESCGEDPLLNSRFAEAAVKGYQGRDNDLQNQHRMAACVKHFAGYGAPEGGREYNTVDISEGLLRDTYLPSYRAALKAGAKMVMTAFNIMERVPSTANKKLFQSILRKEWNFEGTVISDFNAVGELISHGIASDGSEAALKSLNAGTDIEMMSTHYIDYGECLLKQDLISEEQLDNAVLRILKLKNDLGLFENPYKDADTEQENIYHLCSEHRAVSRKIAGETMVLLKNENVLPLNKSKKIGLTGPFADSPCVLGGWSAGSSTGVSLYEGLCNQLSPEVVHIVPCGEIDGFLAHNPDIPFPCADFLPSFNGYDTVIVAVGEHQTDTGEGGSKAFLRLSANQELLIKMLKEAGKSVIAVIFSGRPLEIAPVVPYCDAVLQAWFPGTEAGNALADILTGAVNPSGRLSMSFPYTVGQVPVYYNHFRTGRPETEQTKGTRYISRYLDCPNEPLYCFGYGLSYSSFRYSSFSIAAENGMKASVTVTNDSSVAGTETVQLYIGDADACIVRPVKELKDFKRILLAGGESRTVSFLITKEMLSFTHENECVFEAGEFQIMIGANSDETFSETVYLDETML